MDKYIREARPNEAAALTELILASKAYWGYDAEFMQAAVNELFVTSAYLSQHFCCVVEEQEEVLGFCSLEDRGEALLLENFFVSPEAIGQGVGQRMWVHAVEYGRMQGYRLLTLVADPNAAEFYLKRGAVVTGETLSGVQAGRMLPVMRFEL